MKIFAVGQNKTGTTSLYLALVRLGIDAVHDRRESDRRIRQGLAFDDHEAFLDGGLRNHCLELFEKYHDALFVVTERDFESWIQSRIIHALYNRVTKKSNWREIDTRRWEKEWRQHRVRISKLEEKGAKMLRLCIVDSPSWEPLCEALNREIPDEPFPKANTSESRLRKILNTQRQRCNSFTAELDS